MEQAKNIKIHLTRSASAVDLELSHVPKNELQVTIEILRSSNLYARMRGGDLSVQGVAGDKDLELIGGDLTIQVGNSEELCLAKTPSCFKINKIWQGCLTLLQGS